MEKKVITFEKLVEKYFDGYFYDLETPMQIELWNKYVNSEDEPCMVHLMDEFEEEFADWSHLEVIKILDSNFDANDDFYWKDDYSEICSSTDATDAMNVNYLADWFIIHRYGDITFVDYCDAEEDENGDYIVDEED